MLLAFEVNNKMEIEPIEALTSYVQKVNNNLNKGTGALFLSGRVSIPTPTFNIVFVNVRYWLFNIGFFKYYYAWAFKRGLKRSGYSGEVRRLSDNEMSHHLEVLL